MRSLQIAAMLVVSALIAATAPPAAAADKTLKDAINCSDFKRNADGSWHTDKATLAYGPGDSIQTNYFGPSTITSKDGEMFTALNEKCGGH